MKIGDKVQILDKPGLLDDAGINPLYLEQILGKQVYEKEFVIKKDFKDGFFILEYSEEIIPYVFDFPHYVLKIN
jgi:hypothetical protein